MQYLLLGHLTENILQSSDRFQLAPSVRDFGAEGYTWTWHHILLLRQPIVPKFSLRLEVLVHENKLPRKRTCTSVFISVFILRSTFINFTQCFVIISTQNSLPRSEEVSSDCAQFTDDKDETTQLIFLAAQHENSGVPGLGTLCEPARHTAQLLALQLLSENSAFLSTWAPKPCVLWVVILCTYPKTFWEPIK